MYITMYKSVEINEIILLGLCDRLLLIKMNN